MNGYRDFDAVERILRETGMQILNWRADTAKKQLHSVEDFKTEADKLAHEMIVAGLSECYPGTSILSEEDTEPAESRPELYWLIDPIDGTMSWYNGFNGFVTQAALISGKNVVFGAIFAPALDIYWTGISGQPPLRNGEELPRLRPHSRVAVVDNYPYDRRVKLARLLCDELPATSYVESGSLGLKCCLIADGTADVFAKDIVVRDWDIAPAAPILNGVGASLLLPDGNPYPFEGSMEKPSGLLVARDAHLAVRAVEIIRRSRES